MAMIEIHLKCKDILQQHACFTLENQRLIAQAIGGLALAMFLEMPTVTLSAIRHAICLLEQNNDILTSIQTHQTSFKRLKSLILKNRYSCSIYIYTVGKLLIP